MKKEELVAINIPKSLLTKLHWALASGTDTHRVNFILQLYVEKAELEEGVTYPTDREPGHDFDGFTLKV